MSAMDTPTIIEHLRAVDEALSRMRNFDNCFLCEKPFRSLLSGTACNCLAWRDRLVIPKAIEKLQNTLLPTPTNQEKK